VRIERLEDDGEIVRGHLKMLVEGVTEGRDGTYCSYSWLLISLENAVSKNFGWSFEKLAFMWRKKEDGGRS
jgi:hypothetical protein